MLMVLELVQGQNLSRLFDLSPGNLADFDLSSEISEWLMRLSIQALWQAAQNILVSLQIVGLDVVVLCREVVPKGAGGCFQA
jgi:hypothetical protein